MASEDTDVLLLCLAFKCFIPASMYVKCGTQTRTRYASISSVAGAVGGELCKCLICMILLVVTERVPSLEGKRLQPHDLSLYQDILPRNVQAAGDGLGSIRYAFLEPPRVYM